MIGLASPTVFRTVSNCSAADGSRRLPTRAKLQRVVRCIFGPDGVWDSRVDRAVMPDHLAIDAILAVSCGVG